MDSEDSNIKHFIRVMDKVAQQQRQAAQMSSSPHILIGKLCDSPSDCHVAKSMKENIAMIGQEKLVDAATAELAVLRGLVAELDLALLDSKATEFTERKTSQWLHLGPAVAGFPMTTVRDHRYDTLVYGRKFWALSPARHAMLSKRPIAAWLASPEYRSIRSEGQSLHCVQEPGDILFVPSGWSAGSLNLEESIGVVTNIASTVPGAEAFLGGVAPSVTESVPGDTGTGSPSSGHNDDGQGWCDPLPLGDADSSHPSISLSSARRGTGCKDSDIQRPRRELDGQARNFDLATVKRHLNQKFWDVAAPGHPSNELMWDDLDGENFLEDTVDFDVAP